MPHAKVREMNWGGLGQLPLAMVTNETEVKTEIPAGLDEVLGVLRRLLDTNFCKKSEMD